MPGQYFKLEDDLYLEGRWHLGNLSDRNGAEFDARDFTYGVPIENGPPLRIHLWNQERIVEVQPPLKVSLHTKGIPLDFTFTTADMPVISSRVAEVLAAVARSDIQRIPVEVSRQMESYEILHVISRVDCIDTKRSEIQWFKEHNDVRADLAGTPEMITRLVIDPIRTEKHHIFRPRGWELVIIVSDVVRDALETERITGVRFRSVVGDETMGGRSIGAQANLKP